MINCVKRICEKKHKTWASGQAGKVWDSEKPEYSVRWVLIFDCICCSAQELIEFESQTQFNQRQMQLFRSEREITSECKVIVLNPKFHLKDVNVAGG